MLRDNAQSDVVKIMQGRIWENLGEDGKSELQKEGEIVKVFVCGQIELLVKENTTERSHYPDDLKSMAFVFFSQKRGSCTTNERRIDVTKSREDMPTTFLHGGFRNDWKEEGKPDARGIRSFARKYDSTVSFSERYKSILKFADLKTSENFEIFRKIREEKQARSL